MEEELLNSKETCAFLGVSRRTLTDLIHEGLPHIQVKKNGNLFFRKSRILDWLEHFEKPVPASIKLKKISLIGRKL